MATAAQLQTPRRGNPIALPKGEGDAKRIFINEQIITPIHLVEPNEDGEMVIAEELPDLPLGTKELYVQHRMCGDYYCFIGGKRQVAAIGDTSQEAFRNALKLAA